MRSVTSTWRPVRRHSCATAWTWRRVDESNSQPISRPLLNPIAATGARTAGPSCRQCELTPSVEARPESRGVGSGAKRDRLALCGLPAARDPVSGRDQCLRLANRGDVDQAAVEANGTPTLACRLLHRLQDAPRTVNLLRRRGERLVGQCHLLGVDRPLALASEHGRAARLSAVAVLVAEIAERAIDRAQAVGTCRHHHAGDGIVPHIAPMDLT